MLVKSYRSRFSKVSTVSPKDLSNKVDCCEPSTSMDFLHFHSMKKNGKISVKSQYSGDQVFPNVDRLTSLEQSKRLKEQILNKIKSKKTV